MLRKKSSKNLSFDEAANGIYTEQAAVKVSYNIKELFDFCRSKGIQPTDLTEEELKRFETWTAMISAIPGYYFLLLPYYYQKIIIHNSAKSEMMKIPETHLNSTPYNLA